MLNSAGLSGLPIPSSNVSAFTLFSEVAAVICEQHVKCCYLFFLLVMIEPDRNISGGFYIDMISLVFSSIAHGNAFA